MATDRKHTKQAPTDSKAALIDAAKQVFAEKGYEGATVKDLADEAGVNVSLVSYYFGGKEGLYRTCMENFGLQRVEAAERILKAPSTHEEFKLRMRLFADEFIEIYHRDTNVCKIVNRGMETWDEITQELFQSVFIRIFHAFVNFVAAAQQNGLVKKDLDLEVSTALMFGALQHSLRMDEMRKRNGLRTLAEPAYRESLAETWVRNSTEGIFSQETPK